VLAAECWVLSIGKDLGRAGTRPGGRGEGARPRPV